MNDANSREIHRSWFPLAGLGALVLTGGLGLIAFAHIPGPAVPSAASSATARSEAAAPARPAIPLAPARSRAPRTPDADHTPDSIEQEAVEEPASLPDPQGEATASSAAIIASVEATGLSDEAWTAEPRQIVGQFQEQASAELRGRVELDRLRCHRDACLATATYEDFGALQGLDDAMSQLPEFAEYDGWRHRSPPEQLPAGRYRATWVFFRPGAEL